MNLIDPNIARTGASKIDKPGTACIAFDSHNAEQGPSWCGIQGRRWRFIDPSHALLAKLNGMLQSEPCPRCARILSRLFVLKPTHADWVDTVTYLDAIARRAPQPKTKTKP